MGTVTQRHKGQQRPVVVYGGIGPFRCSKPPFYFGASRVVKVDDADERYEAAVDTLAIYRRGGLICAVRTLSGGGGGCSHGRGPD